MAIDQNLSTSNINTLEQEKFINGINNKVTVRTIQEGRIGYLTFNTIVEDLLGGLTYDQVISTIDSVNTDTELLSFYEAGSNVFEIQIQYTSTGWSIKEYTGSMLMESGDFLLLENGDRILLEG